MSYVFVSTPWDSSEFHIMLIKNLFSWIVNCNKNLIYKLYFLSIKTHLCQAEWKDQNNIWKILSILIQKSNNINNFTKHSDETTLTFKRHSSDTYDMLKLSKIGTIKTTKIVNSDCIFLFQVRHKVSAVNVSSIKVTFVECVIKIDR